MLMDQVISADADTVIVWDVNTGEREFNFRVSKYFRDDDDGITAVAFDVAHRRFLTGMSYFPFDILSNHHLLVHCECVSG